MTKKQPPKGCFLTCQDDDEDLEPIIFNVPATYNERVKIHNWQVRGMAEPRDNTEIFPPKGNLCVAAYNRLGSSGDTEWTTETRSMLAQIHLKHEYEPIHPQRSLLNVRTFAYAEQEDDKEDLRLGDILAGPEVLGCTDYRSTMEVDFRIPYPLKPRPVPMAPQPEPWLLNRRAVGYSLQQLENRQGYNTFLDDNMELHKKIAQVKCGRREAWRFTLSQAPENSEIQKAEDICAVDNKVCVPPSEEINKNETEVACKDNDNPLNPQEEEEKEEMKE